jgi:hypothetical protein
LSLDLPPEVTQFEVPTAVTSLGNDFKFEIIVRTTDGNNTAIETCFEVVNPEMPARTRVSTQNLLRQRSKGQKENAEGT